MTIHSKKLVVVSALIYICCLLTLLLPQYYNFVLWNFRPIPLEIPSYFGHICTSSHKLWSDVAPWLFIDRTLKSYQQSSMYTAWWLSCCPRITILIFGILRLFPLKFRDILVIVVHAVTNFGVMYLHDYLKSYQQSSMYAAWWLYCCPRITILIFGNFRPISLNIPMYSGHICTSSHYFWTDVSPWLFIVRTLKWYQQSSMYAAWWLYWCPRITILIYGISRPLFLKFRALLVQNHTFVFLGILGLFPWKFRDILVIVVHAVTNFGVMYHHDFS
jgi:hypothetical protein